MLLLTIAVDVLRDCAYGSGDVLVPTIGCF